MPKLCLANTLKYNFDNMSETTFGGEAISEDPLLAFDTLSQGVGESEFQREVDDIVSDKEFRGNPATQLLPEGSGLAWQETRVKGKRGRFWKVIQMYDPEVAPVEE